MNTRLFWQIFWALGCIAWNAYGLYLIKQGLAPIGPTASSAGILLCLLFAILFWRFDKSQNKWFYLVLSSFAGFIAAFTIYGAFSKDPSLWPSEAWRWTGIILNGIGVLSCFFGIVSKFKLSDKFN